VAVVFLDSNRMPAAADSRQVFPSLLTAGRGQRRLATIVVMSSAVVFLAVMPFAKTPLPQIWAFIPVYESALVVNDLITAVLLLGHFSFLQSAPLLILAMGYLFTALLTISHGLTFPGLFSPSGLLGAGPQSTAWLYMFWHAGFPLFVIGYAALKADGRTVSRRVAIPAAVATVVALASGLTLLATAGQALLPTIMEGNHYAPAMSTVVTATWLLSLFAAAILWQRRPRTVLDLWLIVVMSAWVFDVALSAVLNAGRFDLGFYAGRIYGLGAASFVLTVLLVENGKLYARLVDMHERTRQLSLEHEEQQQRRVTAIVDSSDDAIIGQDLDGVITSWNSGAVRMFGYLPDEAIGRAITLIIPPERVHEEEEVLSRVRRGEHIDHLETVRRTKDGRLIDVILTIVPLRDANGNVFGASKTARDVTERRQTREALRLSEATALAFIASAAEGILIIDEGGRIVIANRQIEKMFGYEPSDLVGRPMEVLLPERLRGRHVAHRAEYTAEPRVRPMGRGLDLAGRRRDGTEFPVEISLSYVRTSHGVRVMAFVTDITERLVRERNARRADKLALLGTLSAGIAHELNNPLGIIKGRIELILLEAEDDALPPPVREDLGVIHHHVERVIHLVHGLLSYARPSEGERRPTDLNKVVNDTMLLAQKQLNKEGVRVTTSLDPMLPLIVGEPNALEQVLLNLVKNGQQAIGGEGEIRIATRNAARPGWVELVVTDTGPGIPAEYQPRIFDPYFTTKATGTGLGLSIISRIVDEHGGTIEVHSRPGEGAEFVLGFPCGPSETPW
jgi:PAS domain S-box-containing protein